MPGLQSASQFSRETAPRGHNRWLAQKEDEHDILQAMYAAWWTEVAKNEALFKRNVYDNPDLDELDLRQHRQRLNTLMSDGEIIALSCIDWAVKTGNWDEGRIFLQSLDQKIAQLSKILFEWHGELQSQPDIPDSFKRAAEEIEQGKIVDFKEP